MNDRYAGPKPTLGYSSSMIRVSSYTNEEFAKLLKPLLAASSGRGIDEFHLRNSLEDLLVAMGLLAETEEDIAFSEATARRAFHDAFLRYPKNATELDDGRRLPSSRAAAIKARRYKGIAAASNDAIENAIVDAIANDSVVETELRRAVLRSWGRQARRKEEFDWRSDSDALRKAAERLAAFHESQVQVGSPPRKYQETLLRRLAEIFLRHTGSDGGAETVPHAIKSHFIIFAHAAVHPFVAELTPASLSSAWSRLKKR